MSYFRVRSAAWEEEHYTAGWSFEKPAPEWWATVDAGWMIDRLNLPAGGKVASAWGWKLSRTHSFLNRMLAEQAADEKREEKRAAILALRIERAPANRTQTAPTEFAKQKPNSGVATNADNSETDRTEREQNANRTRTEREHARGSSSTASASASADPSVGVAAATDAGALYAVWRQSHPRAGERPTPEGIKAIKRLLVECAGLHGATVYLQWLAESQDEYARQLRGEAPWSDGRVKSYVASLTEAARSPEARLASALAWDARGRTAAPVGPFRVKETVSPEWVTAWKRVCARSVPAADTPERLALADIGGMSAIKAMRAGFEEDQLQRQFVAACTQHANQIQRAAK